VDPKTVADLRQSADGSAVRTALTPVSSEGVDGMVCHFALKYRRRRCASLAMGVFTGRRATAVDPRALKTCLEARTCLENENPCLKNQDPCFNFYKHIYALLHKYPV